MRAAHFTAALLPPSSRAAASAPPTSHPTRSKVDAHMGVDDLIQEFGGMEGLPDANAEHGRLRAIVDDTSAALIDVSRVGNDDFILGGAPHIY